MTQPLMPKATAVWLVENTTLTFGQIAEFCGLHPLEVQGIADGDSQRQTQEADRPADLANARQYQTKPRHLSPPIAAHMRPGYR